MSTLVLPDGLTTITYDVRDYVAQVTLNRPEVHNAFNERMQDELAAVWRHIRLDEAVRVVVLTGAGDRAFCTGIDRGDIPADEEFDPFTYDDPGQKIGPKSQGLWKPVIAAVNGMACGGGFYLLGESDIIIAAESATFFDPHVSFTMTAVYEPILLTGRMAFGDLVRMSLVGVDERMSARTARETGLVCEVVPAEQLLESSRALAEVIAAATAHECPGHAADVVGGAEPFAGTSSEPRQCLPSTRHERSGAPRGPRALCSTEARSVEIALTMRAAMGGRRRRGRRLRS